MNLMNFQQFVNILPIKIFHLVSYVLTADKFVAIWLQSKKNYITEAPSLLYPGLSVILQLAIFMIKVMLFSFSPLGQHVINAHAAM